MLSQTILPRIPTDLHEWTQRANGVTFFISSNKQLLSRLAIQSFYDSKAMAWIERMPETHLELLIENSLMFGLYCTDQNKSESTLGNCEAPTSSHASHETHGELVQIGMARIITDYCTLAYLTDVYVMPEFQGQGLGRWLAICCGKAVETFPYLKGLMLMSDPAERKTNFYKKTLGAEVYRQDGGSYVFMKRRYDCDGPVAS